MKTVFKAFIVGLGLLLFNLSSYAQNTFEEGFIFKNESDTIYGLVRYRPFKDNDLILEFRDSRQDDIQVFKSNQLKGFGYLDGRSFQSMDFSMVNEFEGHLFVEVLIEGRLSLFRLSLGFVLSKNGDLQYLPLKPPLEAPTNAYEKAQLEAELERSNRKIIASQVVDGCDHNLLNDNGFKISQRQMIELVKNYNECIGADYLEYSKEKPWLTAEIKFLVGFNVSKFRFLESTGNDYLDLARFKAVKSVVIGSEARFYDPRISRRLGVIIGVNFQKTDYYGFSSKSFDRVSKSNNDIFYNTSLIKIPFGIDYRLNLSKWPTSLNTGVTFNKYFKFNSSRTEELIYDDDDQNVVNTRYYIEDRLNGNTAGIWLGIATRRELSSSLDIGFEFRYEDNITLLGLNSRIRNFQLSMSLIY